MGLVRGKPEVNQENSRRGLENPGFRSCVARCLIGCVLFVVIEYAAAAPDILLCRSRPVAGRSACAELIERLPRT